MSATPDTKWTGGWHDCSRWKNRRFLRVRFSPRGYWLVTLSGEPRPTQHASREAAKRAAERRAVK